MLTRRDNIRLNLLTIIATIATMAGIAATFALAIGICFQ